MKIILFDLPYHWASLLPFTFTRSISDIRVGIYTIKEKWQKFFPEYTVISLSVDYLNNNNEIMDIDDEMLYINSAAIPNEKLVELIKRVDLHKGLQWNNQLIAYKGFIKYHEQDIHFPFSDLNFLIHHQSPYYQKALLQSDNLPPDTFLFLQYPYQIFLWNEKLIEQDFLNFITSLPQGLLGTSNKLIGPEKKLYISPKAKVEGSIINTNTGFVFIDDDAEIMEGCVIRGPLALCQSATLKMGAKIYGATTIGPHCKIGGEVNNSVFFAYSNKAHDGFIGNSVIGEWCNMGADTNNSNLKNNYSQVKIYNYAEDKYLNTDLQFCGLMMGDHSKCGINTMFNTGTVIGVATNIFGAGFPPKHIPSFTWGNPHSQNEYDIDKLFYTAQEMYHRRNRELTEKDKSILMKVKEITRYHRLK